MQKIQGTIHDNIELDRFELDVEGGTAVAYYRMTPEGLTFTHTEVPAHLRGRGVGSELTRSALEWARARDMKVVAQCPFVAAYIGRHKEFADLAR
ncbi:MAG: N-acetyltransferase [Methylocystis sp.]|nr:N-acetyltransferase [Methylocystis sp.]MBI3275289.1 N-acetyltransferase [Methylocystis sp.]